MSPTGPPCSRTLGSDAQERPHQHSSTKSSRIAVAKNLVLLEVGIAHKVYEKWSSLHGGTQNWIVHILEKPDINHFGALRIPPILGHVHTLVYNITRWMTLDDITLERWVPSTTRLVKHSKWTVGDANRHLRQEKSY